MIETIFVLIGTFVGAGFASGKEIFNFFTIYGYYGVFSIIFFSILLFLLVYKCLRIKTTFNFHNYNEFIFYLENKYKFFNHKFFLILINIFLASSFYIMVNATASLFSYQFNVTNFLSVLVCISICYIILEKNNITFICKINTILMPILILFIIFLCLLNINFSSINDFYINNNFNFFISIFSGLLYFSYNSLLLIPIIFNLKIINKKITTIKVAFIFSFIIFLITLLINLLLLNFYHYICYLDLPILYISNTSFKIFSFFYFFIVLSAIFTTMISSGFAFINNLKNIKRNLKLIIFLLFSFLFAIFSFSELINFFYPVFGFLGFLQIFFIFIEKLL